MTPTNTHLAAIVVRKWVTEGCGTTRTLRRPTIERYIPIHVRAPVVPVGRNHRHSPPNHSRPKTETKPRKNTNMDGSSSSYGMDFPVEDDLTSRTEDDGFVRLDPPAAHADDQQHSTSTGFPGDPLESLPPAVASTNRDRQELSDVSRLPEMLATESSGQLRQQNAKMIIKDDEYARMEDDAVDKDAKDLANGIRSLRSTWK